MLINRSVFVFTLMSVVTGCVSIPSIIPMMSNEAGSKPKKGIVTKVDVGGVIYSEYDYKSVSAAKLTKQFVFSDRTFNKGTIFNGMLIDGVESYCSGVASYGAAYPCLSDTNNDGLFDKAKDLASMSGRWRKLNTLIPYSKTVASTKDAEGFNMQLLYQGVVGDGVSVSYREYKNNMARPAFTQEVKYELDSNGKTLIGFKGARIEVLKATNIELQFRVKKGFSQ